jgi:hypothetical protein
MGEGEEESDVLSQCTEQSEWTDRLSQYNRNRPNGGERVERDVLSQCKPNGANISFAVSHILPADGST